MLEYLAGVASGIVFQSMIKRVWPKSLPTEPTHHFKGDGNFAVKVVGTSYYQKAFQGLPNTVIVTVVHDDNNRHDDQAVKIIAGGKRVGYLSRDDARAYRRACPYKKATCNAKVIGGYGVKHFGMRLDF